MKIKLIYKFIIIMVFISVVPLAVVGIRMVDMNKFALESSIRHNHITTARFLAQGIDDFIEALREKLLFLISSQAIQTLDFKGKQALIQALISSSDYFITVSIVNSRGEEFVKTYHPDYLKETEIKNIFDTELFQNARSGPAISEIYRKNSNPRMDIIYPFGKEYIFITTTLKKLRDDIKNVRIGKESVAFLVDGNGKILAHPLTKMEEKHYNIPPVEAVLTRASLGSMEYEYKGNKMVGAYAPVESMGWGIVTEQPYRFAYESALKMKKDAYRWIIIAVIFAVSIAYLLAGGLSRPILKLVEASKLVAAGNFNNTVKIKTRDELQTLSHTFNDMVKSLKKYDEMQVDKIIEERTKTESIVFSIEDGIILTDYEGKIMLVNNRARELLDMEEQPEEGGDIFNYIKSEELIKAFKGVKETEIDLSTDKSKKIIKAITEGVTTIKGKKLGEMRIIRDITLEKEIEEIKERFLQSITHDLKNPLAAIIGLSDLLKRLRGDNIIDVEKKYFKVLKIEAERLMGMISDILNLAKLEAGKMDIVRKDFNFSMMIEGIKDAFSAEAQNSGIELITDLPEEPIVITADEKLLKRVVINLLGNSLKYTPKGGSIKIESRKQRAEGKNFARVAVIDTGEGMPSEMCEKIFDRFQQIKGQSKGGTGIGLNVSKEIIEAHEGKIWAESEIGKGSKFKFEIPAN